MLLLPPELFTNLIASQIVHIFIPISKRIKAIFETASALFQDLRIVDEHKREYCTVCLNLKTSSLKK
jgi:hypothetical protein